MVPVDKRIKHYLHCDLCKVPFRNATMYRHEGLLFCPDCAATDPVVAPVDIFTPDVSAHPLESCVS